MEQGQVQEMVDECTESLNRWGFPPIDRQQAAPLIEVFSVDIHSDHGRVISIIAILLGSGSASLLLTGPNAEHGPILASGVVSLIFNLKDKSEGVTLIKKEICLDYMDVYDKSVK